MLSVDGTDEKVWIGLDENFTRIKVGFHFIFCPMNEYNEDASTNARIDEFDGFCKIAYFSMISIFYLYIYTYLFSVTILF